MQSEGMAAPSSSTAALVDGLGMARRVRAARRVESTNLTMLGVGALVIGLSILATRSQFSEWIQVLTVPVAFLALWGIVYRRSNTAGVRRRGVGYYVIALIAVFSVLFGRLPLSHSIGALTLLGAGFLIIGSRERRWPVWATALMAIVIGLLTSSETIRRIVRLDETPTSVVPSAIAVLILAVVALAGACRFRLAENRELQGV
ncbi:hypothetical protein QV65_30490 [Rhodococcus erythropolis]|nr:hypothetical protein QV65_30490 [Rhodococcus erythropolis]